MVGGIETVVVERTINVNYRSAEEAIRCSTGLFVNQQQAATHFHRDFTQEQPRFYLSDETVQYRCSHAWATVELTAIIRLVKHSKHIAIGRFKRRVAVTHHQGSGRGFNQLRHCGVELKAGSLRSSRNARKQ